MKTLIAFFSRADENYFAGAMRYVKVGNTEIVCDLIKEMIPADLFKIEMKHPYSPAYMTCIEEAKKGSAGKSEAGADGASRQHRRIRYRHSCVSELLGNLPDGGGNFP